MISLASGWGRAAGMCNMHQVQCADNLLTCSHKRTEKRSAPKATAQPHVGSLVPTYHLLTAVAIWLGKGEGKGAYIADCICPGSLALSQRPLF